MAGKINLTDELKKYFGFNKFKGNQEAIIQNLLDGKDTFVLMPTGGGKSLCYQLPSLLMEGTAIVISPLIALMKNQVDAMRNFSEEDGIAHFINSSLNKGAIDQVRSDILAGKTKLLYVAPESLTKEENVDFLRSVKISFYAVDEAHCISEWGHDFRPEYRRIRPIINEIGKAPLIALTATATPKVQHDIQKNLGMVDAQVFKSSFNRPNLYYEVRAKTNNIDKDIIKFIKNNSEKSGIIYCLSRKKVEELAEILQANGINARPYHAGMDSMTRTKNQDDFLMEKVEVIVATIAFGMGIDKSNVRYVIHYNMPQSMENYYQEAGRAGRDGEPSQCILLFSARDVMIDKFLLEHKDFSEVPPEDIEPIRQRDARRLQIMEGYCQTTSCFRNYILTYFGEKVTSPCDNCGNCHREYHEVDMTAEAKAVLDCVSETKGRYGQAVVVGTLLGANRARLKELGTIHYKSYGSLKDLGEKEIKSLIHQMIVEGYLYQTDDQYSVLKIGNKTLAELENATILVKMYEEKEPSRRQQRGSRRRNTDMLTGEGFELFELLRGLRLEIAREEAVPPYIIFSDKTLIDMCVKLPEDRGTMLDVSGVGQAKYEKYGQRFLTAIREYREKQGDMEICETAEEAAGLPEAESQKGTFDRTEYNRAHNRPEGASRTWDAAEDEELKREFGFGMKIAEIARQHDRTYGAIRARLKKQGMIE